MVYIHIHHYWTTTSITGNWVHTYLVAASIVSSLLVLSLFHGGKAPLRAPPRMHQGHCWPSSLPVPDTSPSQWMTVDWFPVACRLGYQANPPLSTSSPPLPSPLSYSPQWEWGLRERHKQKGRTINNTVHSSPRAAELEGLGGLYPPPPQFLTFTHGHFARIVGCFAASHTSPPNQIFVLPPLFQSISYSSPC